jgi:hypothetical protein
MRKKLLASGIILLFFIPLVSTEMNESDTFDIPYQDGWPQETTGKIDSSPVIADLDNDGKQEIIVGSGADDDSKFKVYVFHHNGVIMEGWPISIKRDIYCSPAIGDLDNDGDLEIIIGDLTHVYAWHHDGAPLTGWPKSIDFLTSSPTLYDIDSDGDLEIIIGGTMQSRATLFVWHHDGTNMEGWPQIITDYDYSHIEDSSPAVGDIDGDGDVEIVVGVRTETDSVYNGYIYGWHHNGQLLEDWPISTGQHWLFISSPALGDLDNDGDLEIVAGTTNGYVWALHHDGNNLTGWPKFIPSWIQDQALADVNQDGELEVISGGVDTRRVYVWDKYGKLLDGWPQKAYGKVYDSPIVGDIAGDEHLEVIMTSDNHKVYAWHYNGTLVAGFPLETMGVICSTPCLGDVDNDGDVELIVGSEDRHLYVWDLPHPYKQDNMEWPMFQHDPYHTGEFSFGRGFCVDANGPYYNRIDNGNDFIGTVLNGEPPFEWHWDFGDGNSSNEQNPTHVYDKVGDYIVNLTVIDSVGNRTYDEDMVYISLFGRDENGALRISITGGFGITAKIENIGTVDAEGVEWSLDIDDNIVNVEDVILVYPVDGKKSGVIDIPACESKSIWFFVLRKLGDLDDLFTYSRVTFYINFSAKIMDCTASDSIDAKIKYLVFVQD